MKTTLYTIADIILAILCEIIIAAPVNKLASLGCVDEANIVLLISTVFIGIYTIVRISQRY